MTEAPKQELQYRGSRILMVSAALVIVIAGLRAIKPIILPFIIASFLSLLTTPLVTWLVRRRIPRFLAVLTAVLCVLAGLAMLGFLVGGSIGAFAESVPDYQERLEKEARTAFAWLERHGIDTAELTWLQDLPDEIDEAAESPAADPPPDLTEPSLGPEARTLPGFLNLGVFVDIVGTTLRSLAELGTMMLLIILMMIFILFEAAGLPGKLRLALGWTDDTLARMGEARVEIQRYLRIKTLTSLVTGLLVGLWVGLVGIDFPQLWGLLAFLLNYIPNLGSFLAAIPALILAWIDLGPGGALMLSLGYAVINVGIGNLVEPHLMGRRLGISTLVVFLSLVFWGWVWGPLGMLLSVPLTRVLQIMLSHTEDLRWVAHLIGPNPDPKLIRPNPGPEIAPP